jgi:branched-chain amino acid transport system ATP-binding protein
MPISGKGSRVLRLEGVTCRYGHVTALVGLSIEIGRGELVALIGSNGAGKTTTLKAISGLLRPAEGRIVFEGEDIGGAPPRSIIARGIAHCPEGRRVFPQMSVRENLEMGCYLRVDAGVIEQDLKREYARFPILAQRRNQPAGTLSGGEQQMLAISRALMSRPRLILFDEPSLGLAPNIAEQTFGIVRAIRDEGTTVVMVEQNAFAALELADRAYVMEQGQITKTGRGRDLLEDPHVKSAYLGI